MFCKTDPERALRCTGYNDKASEKTYTGKGIDIFLAKIVELRDIARAVREVFDK